MAITISHRKWDSSFKDTNSFELLSKFTDLGSLDGGKSLLGMILNVTMSSPQTRIPPPMYMFRIHYRKTPDDIFAFLGEFNLSYNPDLNPQGPREIKIDFNPIIRDISNVQIRIKGTVRGGFGINDIGIIFRTYRDTSTTTLEVE